MGKGVFSLQILFAPVSVFFIKIGYVMKKLFGIFLLSAVLACGLYAAPARGTADYYVQNSARYEGKNIKVFVTGVEQSNKVAPDGYVAYEAYTASGKIYFIVPQKSAQKFFNFAPKLSANSKNTKSYSGIFKKVKLGDEPVWGIVLK